MIWIPINWLTPTTEQQWVRSCWLPLCAGPLGQQEHICHAVIHWLQVDIPYKLIVKLRGWLCNWVFKFLIGMIGSINTSSLTVHTEAPDGCVLRPWSTISTSITVHPDTAPKPSLNATTLDATIAGWITGRDGSELRRRSINRLNSRINNLAFTVSKNKELIAAFRKGRSRNHALVLIGGTEVEKINSFKLLGLHISDDLPWPQLIDAITKKADHASTSSAVGGDLAYCRILFQPSAGAEWKAHWQCTESCVL